MKWIIINFKTYKQATGKNAVKLAKAIDKIGNKKTMISVQATDISEIKKHVKIPILAQHVDTFSQGRNTGFVLPEAIKQAGAIGTLLNHAEHKLPMDVLKKTISRCKGLKLKTIICTASIAQAKQLLKLKPDFIAFEDPKLIATGRSMSKAEPFLVKRFAALFKGTRTIPLCGAGVSTREDVKKAAKLGTKGVLIASAIVKSKNPANVLSGMLKNEC